MLGNPCKFTDELQRGQASQIQPKAVGPSAYSGPLCCLILIFSVAHDKSTGLHTLQRRK